MTFLGIHPKDSLPYHRDRYTFAFLYYGDSNRVSLDVQDSRNVVYTSNQILISHKKSYNYGIIRKWIALEITMLRKGSTTWQRQIVHVLSHMQNGKGDI